MSVKLASRLFPIHYKPMENDLHLICNYLLWYYRNDVFSELVNKLYRYVQCTRMDTEDIFCYHTDQQRL